MDGRNDLYPNVHFIAFDFLTGAPIAELRPSGTPSASDGIDRQGGISVTIDEAQREVLSLRPWRHGLALVVGGWLQVAGPYQGWRYEPSTGYALSAGNGVGWLGLVEVQQPATLAGDPVMAISTVPRSERTPGQSKTVWNPRGQARVRAASRTARAIAALLVKRLFEPGWWGVPPFSTSLGVDEAGSGSWGWDGVDHIPVADAQAAVLAGVEYHAFPYWRDGKVAFDFSVGTPKLTRTSGYSAPLPLTQESVLSVTGDASGYCSVASAVARHQDGYAISETVRGEGDVLLMRKAQLERESASGAEVSAAARSLLRWSEVVTAEVRVPIERAIYTLTAGMVTPEVAPGAPLSSRPMRIVSWSTDGVDLTMNLEA